MPQLVLLRQIIANMVTVQIKENSSENAARHHSQTVRQHFQNSKSGNILNG